MLRTVLAAFLVAVLSARLQADPPQTQPAETTFFGIGGTRIVHPSAPTSQPDNPVAPAQGPTTQPARSGPPTTQADPDSAAPVRVPPGPSTQPERAVPATQPDFASIQAAVESLPLEFFSPTTDPLKQRELTKALVGKTVFILAPSARFTGAYFQFSGPITLTINGRTGTADMQVSIAPPAGWAGFADAQRGKPIRGIVTITRLGAWFHNPRRPSLHLFATIKS